MLSFVGVLIFRVRFCGCSSMVELQPSKLVVWVRFPSPALRLTDDPKHTIVYGAGRVVAGVAAVAQLVECVLGKDEVKGSIPFSSSGFGFLWPSPLAAGLGSCGMSARPEGVWRDG